jgi:type IV secretion system protein VirB4
MSEDIHVSERTVTRLGEFFTNQGENNLYEKLHLWMNAGSLGWIFDNKEDLLNLNTDAIGFNTDNIITLDEAKSPVMAYLWHRVKSRKTGQKSIIVFEEFHQTLDDDYFVREMKTGLKMDRDKNLMYIFTSQSPSDAIESKIASTIVEQVATTIFLSNPKAEYDDYKRFNTSKEEFDIIKKSTKGSRRFIIKKGNKSTVINFDLQKIGEYLPLVSAGKNLTPIFESCIKKYGDKWEKHYIEEAKYV